MAEVSEKTVVLRFNVGEARSIGFATGTEIFLPESPWMSFSLVPADYPSKQIIWMRSDDPKNSGTGKETKLERDGKWLWQLTKKTPGTLFLRSVKLGASVKGDGSNLSWSPETSGSDYFFEESFGVDLLVPEGDFVDIRALMAAGKPPTKIVVYTPDVASGDAPDGSDKHWQVDTMSFAKITAFSIEMSVASPMVLIGPAQSENEIEEASQRTEEARLAILHSREDIQLLCFGQATTNALLGMIRWQLNAVLTMSAVSLVIVVLGYLHR